MAQVYPAWPRTVFAATQREFAGWASDTRRRWQSPWHYSPLHIPSALMTKDIAVQRGGRALDASSVKVHYRTADQTVEETTLDLVRAYDLLESTPIRKFRRYHKSRHYSGWYWSATQRGHIAYESLLERDRILELDFDPQVTAIASQPLELSRPVGRESRRRIPDLIIARADGRIEVIDVKPRKHLDDPEVVTPLKWTARACKSRGWDYTVWSEPANRERHRNLEYLAGYRRAGLIDPGAVAAIQAMTAENVPIRAVEHHLCHLGNLPRLLVRAAILHLLWTGGLAADLAQPLGPDTQVTVVAR